MGNTGKKVRQSTRHPPAVPEGQPRAPGRGSLIHVDRNTYSVPSRLGGAITYLLRHWEKLTLFLRVPGAPLDNNICERTLKKAILHRKNALFYKTENGAHVGDVFMGLIHTCELCGANPFDYLTELERHAGELRSNPQRWMPWNYNYRQTLTKPAASR